MKIKLDDFNSMEVKITDTGYKHRKPLPLKNM